MVVIWASTDEKNFLKKKKTPVQILATIGLVIAILWTAKFIFQLGSAGYKDVKNATSGNSSSGEFPILKCTIKESGETIVKVYDLNVERTLRKVTTNYISWRTATSDSSNNLVLLDHSTDRRTGNYSVKYVSYKNGKQLNVFNWSGYCEPGSNKKLF